MSNTENTSTGKNKLNYTDTTRKLTPSELNFMKLIEQQNLERVQKLQKIRRNNKLTASFLGVSVLGIYFYSMFAVQQEKFLDDFIEPKKVEAAE